MAYPKGKPKSEESKRKASEALKRHYDTDPTARQRRAHFKGKRHPPETIAKMSQARKAYWTPEQRQSFSAKMRRDREPAWAEATYANDHQWMARNHPKTGCCDLCQEKRKTTYAMRNPPFAKRDPEDWLELCSSCHKFYDTRRIVWAR